MKLQFSNYVQIFVSAGGIHTYMETYEDNLKYEDFLKYEDDLDYNYKLKYEAYLKYEDNLNKSTNQAKSTEPNLPSQIADQSVFLLVQRDEIGVDIQIQKLDYSVGRKLSLVVYPNLSPMYIHMQLD